MASAARAVVSGSRSGETLALDAAVISRVKPVCDFVNTEAFRLRNHVIAIGAMAAVGAVVLPLLTGIGDPRIPLVLAAGAVGFTFAKARSEFTRNCARVAIKRIIAALSRQLTYKPSSTLTQQQFVAMDLFPGRVERFRTRDEISGREIGAATRYSLHRVVAGGANRRESIFDGVVAKIDFPEAFPGHTVVIPDITDENGAIGPGTRVKKDLVFLKNPVFEERFSVYASDYYDARRLLTPKLMDVIMESAVMLDAEVRLAFVQRSLFVAVPGEALKVDTGLFAAELTPKEAVGRLLHILGFAERLARAVAH
jgi:hypothetical protein